MRLSAPPTSRAATAVPCWRPDSGRLSSDRRRTSTWPLAKAACAGLIAVSMRPIVTLPPQPAGRPAWAGQPIRPGRGAVGSGAFGGFLSGPVIMRKVGQRLRSGVRDKIARRLQRHVGRDAQPEHLRPERCDFGAIEHGEAGRLKLFDLRASSSPVATISSGAPNWQTEAAGRCARLRRCARGVNRSVSARNRFGPVDRWRTAPEPPDDDGTPPSSSPPSSSSSANADFIPNSSSHEGPG